MVPPKLSRKIFPHLTDAVQRGLIILDPAVFRTVGDFLDKILQRLQIVGIVDRVSLVFGTIANEGKNQWSEDRKRGAYGAEGRRETRQGRGNTGHIRSIDASHPHIVSSFHGYGS